uniref:Uncharacterized protein n=1 Tax=Rhizophora mucronata TaxID=61149 RepID=A0A2P2J0K4_RHIMU
MCLFVQTCSHEFISGMHFCVLKCLLTYFRFIPLQWQCY